MILRAAGTRALSQVLAVEGDVVADLGAGEVAEGLVRTAASEAMAERSEELAIAGLGLAARGEYELDVAGAAADVAADLAEEAWPGRCWAALSWARRTLWTLLPRR